MVYRRNNYTGILTDYEALQLADIIYSVKIGSSAWMVDVYYSKGDFNTVKTWLKRFGTKYPYKSILSLAGGKARYDCAGTGGTGKNNASKLKDELQKVIDFGKIKRDKESQVIFDGDPKKDDYDWTNFFRSLMDNGGSSNNDNKSKANSEDSNLFLYLGIGVAAFLLVFLIMKRKK